MSGIVFSLRDALCLQLGRYFKIWDFDQVQFSDFKPVVAPVGDADMQVTATYMQQKHVLAYKRISLGELFKNFPYILKPIPVSEDPITHEQLVTVLSNRYGIPITVEDIDWEKTVPKTGEFDVVAAATSVGYTGSFRVLAAVSIPDIIDRTSTPIHHWPLAGNTEPAVGEEPLIAVFDYEQINGVTWAGLNTNRMEPLGVPLSCRGFYTLEFKLLVKSIGATPIGLFTVDGSGNGTDVKLATSDTGKYYPYVRGNLAFKNYDGAAGVTLPVGSEAKVVIRGVVNDRAEVYIDGKLVTVVDKIIGTDEAWTHFGKSNLFLGNTVRIRDIKYYDHAIDIAPGQAYAAAWDVFGKFRAQPWYWENYGCDQRGITMRKYNPALLTYGYDYTKYTAFLKTIPAFSRPWNNNNDMQNATMLNTLRDAMKDVDGNAWVWTSTLNTPFNLYRAAVVYNGPTAQCGKLATGQVIFGTNYLEDWILKSFSAPNLEYDNVLVFWLKSTWENNEGYCGCVMLHYNNEV